MGVVTGMAYTQYGGDILPIEVKTILMVHVNSLLLDNWEMMKANQH